MRGAWRASLHGVSLDDLALAHDLEHGLQLCHLQILGLLAVAGHARLAQVGRQLEARHIPPVVAHQHNGVLGVEHHLGQLGLLDDLLAAHRQQLVLAQVKHVHLAVVCRRCKHGGRVRRPRDVADAVVQVKLHDRVACVVGVPQLDRPVGRRRQEHAVALLGAHQVDVVLAGRLAEVHAAATGLLARARRAVAAAVAVGFPQRRRRLGQLHERLVAQLALLHRPQVDDAVGRDRGELQAGVGVVDLPENLPHRIGVLARLHARLVDGLNDRLVDVVDHDAAVVAADREQVGVAGVEVQRHHARIGHKLELGVRGILEREDAHQARRLLQKVVRAIPNCKHVEVLRRPADAGHLAALGLVAREAPQRQERALARAEAVARVLPVLEVHSDLLVHVLVDHAVEDFCAAQHVARFHRVGAHRLVVRCRGRRRSSSAAAAALLLALCCHALLDLLPLQVLDVLVVNLPLGARAVDRRGGRRVSVRLTIAQREVRRLTGALAEVELVAQLLAVVGPLASVVAWFVACRSVHLGLLAAHRRGGDGISAETKGSMRYGLGWAELFTCAELARA
eukprot:365457-Chlamydomonas_euryale.AAC.9